MSQWQTAGKVRMTPRGIWSASTAYVVLDCVSNIDKTAYYVAKQSVPAGTLLTSTEYWEVVNDISSIANNMNTKIDTLDEIVGLGYPTKEVAGGIATLENTIEAGLNSFTLYGKSVQNGTPSPSSPVSIATAGSSESIGMVSVDINTDIHIPITDTTKFIDENGNITDNADYLLTDYIPLSGNYLYVQWNNVVGSACYLRRAYYDSSKSFIRRDIHQLTQGRSDTFWTPLATARYVRICVENSATNRIYGLQVHDGYGVNIPTPNGLLGIPVVNGGNYIDKNGRRWVCDTIDLNSGVYTKRCGVVTFDGSETWTAGSISGRYYVIASLTPNAPAYANHLCTHAIANSGSTTRDMGKSFFTSGGNFDINTSYESADAFKAALATSNMTLIYELTTPVIIQLTEAQLTAIRSLHSRRGMTYIYSSDPVSPGFDAELFVNMRSSTVDTLTKMNSPSVSNTGKVVTIDGTIDAPLEKLVIYGKSAQGSTTPTPSAPVSIVTAGESGTLPMVSAGKNLLSFTYNASQTVSGVTFTSNPDGTVNVSGTNTGSDRVDFNLFRSAISGFLPNGTYTVSGFPTDGTGLSACVLTARTNDKSGGNANYFSIQANGRTFVCTDASTITSIYISVNPGTAVNAIYAPMLNFGTGAEEYSPPVNIAATIPTPGGLSGIPVASGGNYTDTNGQQWICDTIDLETGIWTKRCGTVTFDGQSESGWERVNAANSKYRFRNTTLTSEIMKAATNDTVVPLLCTYYTATSANATWTNSDVDGISVDNGGGIFIADAALRDAGTLEQFLARFQNTSMVIVYPLATPIVTKLTNTQLVALNSLRSHKGQTNLYSTDPAAPELTAKLYIDIPTYINSLIN